MNKQFMFAVLMICGFSITSGAHPHLFVDAKLTILFDEKGMAGIEEHWTFDEMFSAMIIEEFDKNKDKKFDVREMASLKNEAFSNLESFEYLTHVRIDGTPFKVKYVKDFRAEIENEKIIYKFSVPCHVTAIKQNKTIKISVFDMSYYTAIQIADDKSEIKGEFELFEVHTKTHRVKEFICFEEDGFPETLVLKFRRQQ
jgi:ABC-type uncharacterized transport system substrate-binding protein